MKLSEYVTRYAGRSLDVDGIYGAQCWDLWSHYATTVAGVPFARTVTRAGAVDPHPGWACNVYHNAEAAGLLHYFDRLTPKAPARAGDVAFWEISKRWPGSHVAIVLYDAGDELVTLSQNPGPPRRTTLPKTALLGYLRPLPAKASAPATTAPAPPVQKGTFMSYTPTEEKELLDTVRAIREGQVIPGAGYTYDQAMLPLLQGLYRQPGATVDVDALAAQLRETLGDIVADELADRLRA